MAIGWLAHLALALCLALTLAFAQTLCLNSGSGSGSMLGPVGVGYLALVLVLVLAVVPAIAPVSAWTVFLNSALDLAQAKSWLCFQFCPSIFACLFLAARQSSARWTFYYNCFFEI